MFYPPLSITGWSPSLVKLAMALSISAYSGDFSRFNGTLLYSQRDSAFEQPVFYVYKLDSNLWIVNRGASDVFDVLTCAEFNETTTSLGTFHLGIYHAAQFTLEKSRSYIEEFEGPIYFTGHSYGGTVAPLLQVLTLAEMPNKDLNAIGFAPMPHMDDDTSTLHKDKIASFVNNADIVPTLSVANLYVTLRALIPFFEEIDEDALVAELESLLDLFWIFLPTDLYNALREVIPDVADAVLGYSHGEQRLIRYPPGHVYQLFKDEPKPLAESEVDPTKVLNALSLSVEGFRDHPQSEYEVVVDQIPDDRRWQFF
jgi:hypothetical protein